MIPSSLDFASKLPSRESAVMARSAVRRLFGDRSAVDPLPSIQPLEFRTRVFPMFAPGRYRSLACWITVSLCLAISQLSAAGDETGTDEHPTADGYREVYVPSDELQLVFQRDKKGVLLPRDEFQKLVRQAAENSTERRPAGIVIRNASYSSRIDGPQLLITAKIDFSQFVNGWQEVTLPLRRFSVEQATIDGHPARLGRRHNSPHALVLFNDATGDSTLELELSTALSPAGSDQIAAFGFVNSPVAQFEIVVPAGKHLLLDGLSVERPSEVEQPARYQFPVGGRKAVRLRITDRSSQKQTADTLVFANTEFSLQVAPGEIAWRTSTSLDVFGSSLDQVRFTVPQTLEIVSVESSGLEAWQLEDDADDDTKTSVTLSYRQPFEGTRTVKLTGLVTQLDDESWSVPILGIQNVNSHVARLVIEHSPGIRLLPIEQSGVRRTADVPAASAPARAEGHVAKLIFEAWQEDFFLEFVTQQRRRELLGDMLSVVEITDRGVDLETVCALETLNDSLYDLDVELPQQWSIRSVTIDSAPIHWKTVSQRNGVQRIQIPFAKPLAPGRKSSVIVAAHLDLENWPLGNQTAEFSIPEVRFPQSTVVDGTFAVRGDPDFEIVPSEITGLDPSAVDLENIRLGYSYQDTRYSGLLQVSPKAARISAKTVTVTRLDRQALRTHLEILLDVAGGGLQQLQVVLPVSASDLAQFSTRGSPARIIEQQVTDADDQSRSYQLTFDRRLKGKHTLACLLDSPREEANSFSVPTVRIPAAERQHGVVAIEASPEQHLTIETQGANGRQLAEVDAVDLPRIHYQPRERVVAAYLYIVPGYSATLEEQRFDRMAVPTAICRTSRIRSILSETGELQHHADLELSAIGIQFLRLALPEGAQLWATLIDGRPVEVRRTTNAFLVPIPSTGASDNRHTVRINYTTSTAPLSYSGRLQQQPPQLSVVAGDGEEQPLDVLEQHWTLNTPEQTMITQSHGLFATATSFDDDGWIDQLFRRAADISFLQLAMKIGGALLVLAAVVLCVRGYSRWGWGGMGLGIGLVGVLLVAVLLVRLVSDRQLHTMTQLAAPVRDFGAIPRSDKQAPVGDFQVTPKPMPQSESKLEAGDEANMEATAAPQPPAGAESQSGSDRARSIIRPHVDHDFNEQDVVEQVPQSGSMAGLEPPPPGRKTDAKIGGGLLSVALDLETPDTHRPTNFRYVGTNVGATGGGLDVSYTDRDMAAIQRLLLFSIVALVFWFCRRRQPSFRGSLAVLGLLVPLGLSTVVSPYWQTLLDGVFFGSLAGLLLWGIHTLCTRRRTPVAESTHPPQAKTAATAGLLLFAVVVFGGQTTANAEEPNHPTDTKPAPQLVADDQRKETVIVPYAVGEDPLSANRVYLPYQQFLKLWNQAHPEQQRLEAAPIDGLVTAAIYSAEVHDTDSDQPGSVAVRCRYLLHSFRDHQIQLSVPLGRVALQAARLDDDVAVVQWHGAGKDEQLRVILDQPGEHVLDVEFSVPLQKTGPAGRFLLPLRPVSSGRLSFTLPASDLQIRVNGTTSGYRRSTEGDIERLQLPVDVGGDLSIAWQPREERGAIDSSIMTDASIAAIVDDTGLMLSYHFDIQVRQGALNELAFQLPDNLRLKRIQGPDVAGWEKGDGESKTMRVFFRRAIEDATTVQFQCYQPLEVAESPTEFALPAIVPLNVTRATANVGLFAGQSFVVGSQAGPSGRQINPDQFRKLKMDGLPAAQPELAYRFTSIPFELAIEVSRRMVEARADAEYAAIVGRRKLHLTMRMTLSLLGAPRSRSSIYLPEGFLPLSLDATALADWYIHDDGEEQLAIVEFAGPRSGSLEIVLKGTLPIETRSGEVELNLPFPIDVHRMTSRLVVWVDSSFLPELGEHEGWRSVGTDELSADFRGIRPDVPPFVLRTSPEIPEPLTIRLRRANVRLTADSINIINVTDQAVYHTLALQWRIPQAATDTFSFVTDNVLADRLDFDAPGLRAVEHAVLDDDRIRWTVTLQRPVTGKYFLTATAALAPSIQQTISTPTPEFVQKQPNGGDLPLEIQRPYVLLVNHSIAQLTVVNAESYVPVDADELPITVQQELIDQAAEIAKINVADRAPVWTVRHFERQPGAPASVNLATLTTVIERDGSLRGVAEYRIKNRSRQFLALTMPSEIETQSIFVKQQPSRAVLRRTDQKLLHLIPLPKVSEADLSFVVRVVYAGRLAGGPLPAGSQFAAQEIDFPAPEVVPLEEDDNFGIPVAETHWNVSLPKGFQGSLIDDRQRTNVRLAAGGDQWLAYEASLLGEAEQLSRLLLTAPSSRVRRQAAGNLDKLEQALRSSEQGIHVQGDFPDGEQLAERQRELQLRRSKLFQEIERNREKMSAKEELPSPQYMHDDVQFFPTGPEFRQQVEQQNRALIMYNSAITEDGQLGRSDDDLDGINNTIGLGQALDADVPVQTEAVNGQKPAAAKRKGDSVGKQINQRRGERNQSDREEQVRQLGQQLKDQRTKTFDDRPKAANAPVQRPAMPAESQSDDGQNVAGQYAGPTNGYLPRMRNVDDPFVMDQAINVPVPGDVGWVAGANGGQVSALDWKSTGGLSLAIEIPSGGESLTFTKVGGTPRLALSVRSQQAIDSGFQYAWTFFWVAASVVLIYILIRGIQIRTPNLMAKVMLVIGLILFLFCAVPLSWIGFVVFAIGATMLGVRHARATA